MDFVPIAAMVSHARRKLRRAFIVTGMLLVFMLSGIGVSYAQTATPIPPTATIVPLNIPINSIFTQANMWISTLSPIASLGIGVIIALAVFGFLSAAIKSAFG